MIQYNLPVFMCSHCARLFNNEFDCASHEEENHLKVGLASDEPMVSHSVDKINDEVPIVDKGGVPLDSSTTPAPSYPSPIADDDDDGIVIVEIPVAQPIVPTIVQDALLVTTLSTPTMDEDEPNVVPDESTPSLQPSPAPPQGGPHPPDSSFVPPASPSVGLLCGIDQCSESHPSRKTLKEHQRSKHGSPPKENKEDNGHKCMVCNAMFKNKFLLRDHMKGHKKSKKCKYCQSSHTSVKRRVAHELICDNHPAILKRSNVNRSPVKKKPRNSELPVEQPVVHTVEDDPDRDGLSSPDSIKVEPDDEPRTTPPTTMPPREPPPTAQLFSHMKTVFGAPLRKPKGDRLNQILTCCPVCAMWISDKRTHKCSHTFKCTMCYLAFDTVDQRKEHFKLHVTAVVAMKRHNGMIDSRKQGSIYECKFCAVSFKARYLVLTHEGQCAARENGIDGGLIAKTEQ